MQNRPPRIKVFALAVMAALNDCPAQPVAEAVTDTNQRAAPANLTTQPDHRLMMELRGIRSLRPGANPNNPSATNAVNYDEAKADPYPNLPNALTLKRAQKVTTAEVWWNQRRPYDRPKVAHVPELGGSLQQNPSRTPALTT